MLADVFRVRACAAAGRLGRMYATHDYEPRVLAFAAATRVGRM